MTHLPSARPVFGAILRTGAALAVLASVLSACSPGAKEDSGDDAKSAAAMAAFQAESAEAMQMQSLPWFPAMDPQQFRYGPFTPYANADVVGPWTVGPGPDGFRVSGNSNPNETYRGTGSLEPGAPGYRITLYIQIDYLNGDDAAAGLIFGRFEDEMAILTVRGDGKAALFLADGADLQAPATFGYEGELGPGRHMMQAVLMGADARLFINGRYIGKMSSDYLIGQSNGTGFFANGNAGMTIGGMTVETLPRFTPPGGSPGAGPR